MLTAQLLTFNFQHWAGRATLSCPGTNGFPCRTGKSTPLAVNEHYPNIGLLNAESPIAITDTEPAAASASLGPTREKNALVLEVVNTSARGTISPRGGVIHPLFSWKQQKYNVPEASFPH